MTRRHILALTGGGLLSRIIAAPLPDAGGRKIYQVDRLIEENFSDRGSADCRLEVRKYSACATVTLFSIRLVSRTSVGSGYAVVEESKTPGGNAFSIQFGAGSYPERARGLNRLGFVQEAIVEKQPGEPIQCAWLAFMTNSQEKSLEQAKKALETSDSWIGYSASQGYGQRGRFASRVERLQFPASYTWRDADQLIDRVRGAMTLGTSEEQTPTPSTGKPATFLYQIRRAMSDEAARTTSCLVFNNKQFRLDAEKERDGQATSHFVQKGLIQPSGHVIRMNAALVEKRTGEKSSFRLWYEAGAGHAPPLRFEYQARSFLRLTFEADANAPAPAIRFALKASKENT